MSREIRTPLNAVIGFTDLISASGRLDPGNRRQAELVRSSGSALLAVVNDILDFPKVEAGAVELVEAPFPLLAMGDNCVSVVRGQADAKRLEFRLREVLRPPVREPDVSFDGDVACEAVRWQLRQRAHSAGLRGGHDRLHGTGSCLP